MTSAQFDAIVGNPPYQATASNGVRLDQASNLWTAFYALALRLTKNDGYVSLISPNTWISPCVDYRKKADSFDGNARLWDTFNNFTTVADIDAIGKHFSGIGANFSLVTIDKSGCAGLSFTGGYSTTLGFLPRVPATVSQVAKLIDGPSTIGSKFVVNQAGEDKKFTNRLRVSFPISRSVVTEEMVEILQPGQLPTKGAATLRNYFYVYVNSMTQAEKVKDTLTDPDNLQLLTKDCRWVGFVNYNMFKRINY